MRIKGMAYNFAACDRNQPYLLPPSLTDRLPDNHLAWFVIEAVEHIDIKPFFTKYAQTESGIQLLIQQ